MFKEEAEKLLGRLREEKVALGSSVEDSLGYFMHVCESMLDRYKALKEVEEEIEELEEKIAGREEE
jgi:hypothetical protein